MAKWQYHLDLKEIWRKLLENEIIPAEFSKVAAEKITEMLKKIDKKRFAIEYDELEAIRDEFDMQAEDLGLSKDDIDEIMSQLYDWGDIVLNTGWPTERMCWIATEF